MLGFKFDFGAKGELSEADTKYNIEKLFQVCRLNFGNVDALTCLPVGIPKGKEEVSLPGDGIPCNDFMRGLAKASTRRRLQAAAVAAEILLLTEQRRLANPCKNPIFNNHFITR